MLTATLLACAFAVAGPAEDVSKDRLVATVRSLPTARAALGDAASRAGLAKTETLLLEQWKALGYEPHTHEFVWASPALRQVPGAAEFPAPAMYRNVIAELKGSLAPREVLIVAAHFDAVPQAPGADDDGTGTAAVLEIARVLKDSKPKRTIRFIHFNLEEVGLVGSTAYVRDHAAQFDTRIDKGGEKVVGMMSIEMLGYYSDQEGSQRIPPDITLPAWIPKPTKGDWIGMAGIAKHQAFSQAMAKSMRAHAPKLKLLVGDFFAVAPPDLRRSDHWPFLEAGIPAVIFADTAELRNPNYHQPTDTVETLDLDRFTLVVRGLAGAIADLANPADTLPEPAAPAGTPK